MNDFYYEDGWPKRMAPKWWSDQADRIAVLRDDEYDDDEIEEELGFPLCWCRENLRGHHAVHNLRYAETVEHVEPPYVETNGAAKEVVEVVKKHFQPTQVERLLQRDAVPSPSLAALSPAFHRDMEDLERELEGWDRGSQVAPLMGDVKPKAVSRSSLALALAQAFAEARERDWFTLEPRERRLFLGLAQSAVEALGLVEVKLFRREKAGDLEKRIQAREGQRAA